ncbi:glycoside hydrolase family 2 protein [Paraburkholderia sp. HP33-1]|uniref:glycoside hydrolase family 2 protein n=1 Tax=Paraburkholderia sp. HP33-1 TaxID=2883243 RepID=UPI001F483697|nr:glycoside hydrolase family 2 protein [Paraburkholderia sp. HP33-1]
MAIAGSQPARRVQGWKMRATPAGAAAQPRDIAETGSANWIDAAVPGTVAHELALAGSFDPLNPTPLGSCDYWYRLNLSGTGRRLIRLHGLATIAEVWFNDTLLLRSTSMFVSHETAVNLSPEGNTLYLCFRSMDRHLQAAVPARRARWRTRLVDAPGLRGIRTTLLGHMPGWFPSIEPIGPWRDVEVVDPEGPPVIWQHSLRSFVRGRDGGIDVTLRLAAPISGTLDAHLSCGGHETPFVQRDAYTFHADLTVANVKLWWPHTHGEPTLYDVTVRIGSTSLPLGRTGFRTLALDRGRDNGGFALSVNGLPMFARGACWSSADPLRLHADASVYRHYLQLAKAAGFNMIRVAGITVYEDDAFYALCDEMGLLVWQDFMFANFDYPSADPSFSVSIEQEAIQFLERCGANPSLAVLCGGSEIAQQAAMVGLDATQRQVELTAQKLADIAALHRPDAIYVSDSPCGDPLPFFPREGVSHYYGVGAYRRPLDDARRADVRFASECLAFANVPCDATLDAIGSPMTDEPRWKTAVPRDPGASWDFDDVRDHYLRELYAQDPARLRSEDPARYLELSRAVIADLYRETFSEWRRIGSRCSGALAWQFQDVMPGAGWGIIDAYLRPKSPWYAMRHSLQPQQILLLDEGLNGLDIHLLNDRQHALNVRVEVVALRDGRVPLVRAHRDLSVEPHGGLRINSVELLGRFFDFTYAYQFGPREHDTVIASMYSIDSGALLSQAFYFPDRTHPSVFERGDIGLEASAECCDGQWWVNIRTLSVARFVQISAPDMLPEDNWFHLAPGAQTRVGLAPDSARLLRPLLFESSPPKSCVLPDPIVIDVRAVNSAKSIRLRIAS